MSARDDDQVFIEPRIGRSAELSPTYFRLYSCGPHGTNLRPIGLRILLRPKSRPQASSTAEDLAASSVEGRARTLRNGEGRRPDWGKG